MEIYEFHQILIIFLNFWFWIRLWQEELSMKEQEIKDREADVEQKMRKYFG